MADNEESKSAALAQTLGTVTRTVTVGAREVTLRPLVLTQIADVMLVLDRLSNKGVVTLDDAKKFDFTKMLLRGGHDVIEILQIATGLEREELGTLDGISGVNLAKGIWEVNEDFFWQNQELLETLLGPTVAKAKAFLVGIVGNVLSLVLSSMDTASKPSKATPSDK
ncbi:MAG: hypothetical protein QOG00_268 [Pyrinomonadaceae bacterium]|nr:hypothetical protein [Pyrinomonadaceae bacterium]